MKWARDWFRQEMPSSGRQLVTKMDELGLDASHLHGKLRLRRSQYIILDVANDIWCSEKQRTLSIACVENLAMGITETIARP